MKRLVLFLACLNFLFLISPDRSDAAEKKNAAAWPTKQFVVKWHSPGILDSLFSFPSLNSLRADENEKARIVSWDSFIRNSLTKIAEYYENAGLYPPKLEKTGEKGNERYVIYAYNLKEGFVVTETEKYALGYYSPPCSGWNKWFSTTLDLNPFSDKIAVDVANLKRRVMDTDDTLVRNFYSALAHELFHSIQYRYDEQHKSIYACLEDGGNGRKAVIEGTATAAAALATEDRYPGYLDSLDSVNVEMGRFPYGTKPEFLKAASPLGGDSLQYKTSSFWRYLAERFGGKEYPVKVFDRLLKVRMHLDGSEPTLKDRYRWLSRAVKIITGKPLYILFPEFQPEFASYVPERYGFEANWLKHVYGGPGEGCFPVTLDSENFYTHIELDGTNKLFRNSARCIKLRWKDLGPDDEIEVQAVHPDKSMIDQVHLGVSKALTDSFRKECFAEIKSQANGGRPNLECSFGKVFIKSDPNGKHVRPVLIGTEDKESDDGFFSGKLANSGTAELIVSNMANTPGDTKDVTGLILEFAISSSKLADGRKGTAPRQIQLRNPLEMIPGIPAAQVGNAFVPAGYISNGLLNPLNAQFGPTQPKIDRYSIYGIKKKASALPGGFGSSFEIRIAGNPKKKYTIAPMDPAYKFEAMGKMQAIVSNEKGETSTICHIKTGGKKVMEVTKSDKKQLRFNIDTNICRMKPNGEVEVVDRLEGKFIYAFGRRAYPATAPQDVITPGLELYIDEYLKELARRGVPLAPTVLMSDGSVPGDEDGDGSPDNAPNANPNNNSTNNRSTDSKGCNCSCSEFARIKKLGEQAKKDPSKRKEMMAAMACLQVCMPQYSKCKK